MISTDVDAKTNIIAFRASTFVTIIPSPTLIRILNRIKPDFIGENDEFYPDPTPMIWHIQAVVCKADRDCPEESAIAEWASCLEKEGISYICVASDDIEWYGLIERRESCTIKSVAK